MKQPEKAPLVSVVVLNYSKPEQTINCIRSVLKSKYSNLEIIVVDNCSSDKSFNFLTEKTKSLKFSLLRTNANLGYAGGNNVGIRKSRGKYILILNDDIIVDDEVVGTLVRIAESNDTVGIVGPLLFRNKSPAVWGYLSEIREAGSAVVDVPNVLGAALLIKREVIQRIGLLDENYFLYHEEWDWCVRARKIGYRTVCAVNCHAWHKVADDKDEFYLPYRAYFFYRNYFIFAAKHFTNRNALVFLFKYLVYQGRRDFTFFYPFDSIKNRKVKALTSYFVGIKDGFVYYLRWRLSKAQPLKLIVAKSSS